MAFLFEDSLHAIKAPLSDDFESIQDLCRAVYPSSMPWSLDQLKSHQSIFPMGQLICIDKTTNELIGAAFSVIICWDDYETHQSWREFTDSGTFQNHDPENGKTLYGAEVMVHPKFQGQGIGKKLYLARRRLTEELGLLRIRAGARLRGYQTYSDRFSPQEYVAQVVQSRIFDPTLSFQLKQGFVVIQVVKGYLLHDPESLGYAAVIEWLNPAVATEEHFEKQKLKAKLFFEE